MKRREILKSAGALASAALLPGCKHKPGTIDTVVYVMMENRTYDHVFGARSMLEGKPGDGLTRDMSNPDASGKPVAPFVPAASALCVPDPPHSWKPAHAQFGGGAMDGFLRQHQATHPGDLSCMQHLTRAEAPVSWALADAYSICDRWFASVMGPTWPNRYYWLSGTSMGMDHNAIPAAGYTAPTVFGRLLAAGIDCRLYYSDVPFVTLMGKADFELDRLATPIDSFFEDAARGRLPHVSYVDPPFVAADDHPPHHPIRGQQFIASVYQALARSPQWERCLLLVTYDEHGGFFDHVPPPRTEDDHAALGFDQLGFRVPAIVAGPYVKAGHVSSVVRNHASALRQIQTLFGAGPDTARIRAAPDLSELIDQGRLSRGEPARPAAIPAIDEAPWKIDDDRCGKEIVLGAPEHDINRLADQHPELVARFDRRPQIEETMRMIARMAGASR
jgi:phospholipase C